MYCASPFTPDSSTLVLEFYHSTLIHNKAWFTNNEMRDFVWRRGKEATVRRSTSCRQKQALYDEYKVYIDDVLMNISLIFINIYLFP